MTDNQTLAPVLIAGDCKTANTVAICLLLSKQPVVLLTNSMAETVEILNLHASDVKKIQGASLDMGNLMVTDSLDVTLDYAMAIGLTNENLADKREMVRLFEKVLKPEIIIAVNTESIALQEIQQHSNHPERIIGANWVEPAHTTFFLEVIANNHSDSRLVSDFVQRAKQQWNKDPYVVSGDHGLRARLMCALIREAFYLVENGYVTFEDIDRACRNDPGYYLPFAGNFRYMDLMGTYIYGIVMKDMNPDLTRQHHVPDFFKAMLREGSKGMENNQGFYTYQDGDAERWNERSRVFSYQIREVMEKYNAVM